MHAILSIVMKKHRQNQLNNVDRRLRNAYTIQANDAMVHDKSTHTRERDLAVEKCHRHFLPLNSHALTLL